MVTDEWNPRDEMLDALHQAMTWNWHKMLANLNAIVAAMDLWDSL